MKRFMSCSSRRGLGFGRAFDGAHGDAGIELLCTDADDTAAGGQAGDVHRGVAHLHYLDRLEDQARPLGVEHPDACRSAALHQRGDRQNHGRRTGGRAREVQLHRAAQRQRGDLGARFRGCGVAHAKGPALRAGEWRELTQHQPQRRVGVLPRRGRRRERAHTADPFLRQVGDDLAFAFSGQRQHRLAFGHHLAALEAQRGDDAGVGRHQRGVALPIARQVELTARLFEPGRGRVGARLLALVVGSADRAVSEQAAQARLVGRSLLRIHRCRLHLIGGGAHAQTKVGRIQPRQCLAGFHDLAHVDEPVHDLAGSAEAQVGFDARTTEVNARLRGHGLRRGGHEDWPGLGGRGGRLAASGQQHAGGGQGQKGHGGKK
ncbi:hypothetical protein LP417_26535 [Polaromonas sp. P1-6]|nr:hypothetical protein LP417_26535 [Polaromonas sp. P1-6]